MARQSLRRRNAPIYMALDAYLAEVERVDALLGPLLQRIEGGEATKAERKRMLKLLAKRHGARVRFERVFGETVLGGIAKAQMAMLKGLERETRRRHGGIGQGR